jgi:hypothetical protein
MSSRKVVGKYEVIYLGHPTVQIVYRGSSSLRDGHRRCLTLILFSSLLLHFPSRPRQLRHSSPTLSTPATHGRRRPTTLPLTVGPPLPSDHFYDQRREIPQTPHPKTLISIEDAVTTTGIKPPINTVSCRPYRLTLRHHLRIR